MQSVTISHLVNWLVSHYLQLFSPFYHIKRKRRRKISFAWGNSSSPLGQKLYPLAVSGMKSFRVWLPRRCDPAILSLTSLPDLTPQHNPLGFIKATLLPLTPPYVGTHWKERPKAVCLSLFTASFYRIEAILSWCL